MILGGMRLIRMTASLGHDHPEAAVHDPRDKRRRSNQERVPIDHPCLCTRRPRTAVNCRQSLTGRMDTFAPLSRRRTRRGMNEQCSAWWNAVEGLPAVRP